MSTIIWIPDTPTEPVSPNGAGAVELAAWDGGDATSAIDYLKASSGTTAWPTPAIDQATGALHFDSFSGTFEGSPFTVPAYDFPLGAVIFSGAETTPADLTHMWSRSYLELHGTIRTEY